MTKNISAKFCNREKSLEIMNFIKLVKINKLFRLTYGLPEIVYFLNVIQIYNIQYILYFNDKQICKFAKFQIFIAILSYKAKKE